MKPVNHPFLFRGPTGESLSATFFLHVFSLAANGLEMFRMAFGPPERGLKKRSDVTWMSQEDTKLIVVI